MDDALMNDALMNDDILQDITKALCHVGLQYSLV